MTIPGDETWLDEAAGRLVRPYAISNGRTKPTRPLDLMSVVGATGLEPATPLDIEHATALNLCRIPVPVAEISARMRLPLTVTKILLCDLIEAGAATTRPARPADYAPDPPDPTDPTLLQEVLDGLRRRR